MKSLWDWSGFLGTAKVHPMGQLLVFFEDPGAKIGPKNESELNLAMAKKSKCIMCAHIIIDYMGSLNVKW